jgi:hypothetical protein
MRRRAPGSRDDSVVRGCARRAAALALSITAIAAGGTPSTARAQGATSQPPVLGRPHGVTSGEARSVNGRVVLGSRTAMKPLVGAWVVLHRVGTDRAAPLDSVRTDGDGRYTFRYHTSGEPNAVYFVSSLYGGVAYFTSPLTARAVSGDDARLVVHDTTSAPIPIHVRGRHIVFATPGEHRRRTVLEVYELSNDSTLTRVAGGAGGMVWQARLLDRADSGRVAQSDFSDGAARFEAGRVQLAAPFAPGLKQFSFSYDVPTQTEYSLVVEEPADVLEVLVEDALARAEGGGLASMGATTTGGRTFARFLAQDVPTGAVIRISAPGTSALSGNQLRVLALMAALGAVLLVGLARAMYRRQRAGGGNAGDASAATWRAQIAALDDAFAKIERPTEAQRADHWQARAHLDKQLSDAVAREQGLT